MTVQISVTVWTILCFLVLMLVLDRLLFRPLLDFMDKRREKIDGARAARETARREREAELRQREETRLAAKKQAMAEASAAMEEAKRDNAARLAEKKAENAARLARLREELDEESREILAAAEPRTEELAEVFAARIQSWQFQGQNPADGDDTAAPRAEEPLTGPARSDN